MPTEYHHGVRVVEINEGIRPIRTIATAVLGLLATAPDADPAVFPANEAVLITNPQAAIAKSGTEGTLAKVLKDITSQANPVCIICRVTHEAEAEQEVIDAAVSASIIKILNKGSQLGIAPRIIGFPGLDTPSVASSFSAYLGAFRSFFYCYASGCSDVEDVISYRESFSSREMMLIWPSFLQSGESSDDAGLHAVAIAMGLRAKIDNEVGWHKTLSNVPVAGVTSISKAITFDLQNTETDADLLNSNDVTTLVNIKGFRFWGSRTCSDDSLFAFENYTRTAHVLADTIAEAMLWAVDKPMHPSLIRDIIESINAKFRQLKALGYIIDANAWYDPEVNTSTTLKDGQLYIDYDYTPVPPLENLMLRQRITDRYLADFAQRIAAA